MDHHASQKKWLAWLNKVDPKGISNLDKQARLYVKAIDRIDLPESIHPFHGLDKDDQLQEARCSLYSASKDYLESASPVDVLLITSNQQLKILQKINNKLITRIKEENRQKKHNIWGYTYRKARETFNTEQPIYTKTRGETHPQNYQLYSLKENSPLATEPSLFPENKADYRQWSTPRQFVTDEDCLPIRSKTPKAEQTPSFKRKHYVTLGSHFWNETCGKIGNHYLPVREFIYYLTAFYQWMQPPHLDTLEESKHETADASFEEKIHFKETPNKSGIQSLAKQFTEQWQPETRHLFYFTNLAQPPLSISEIARLLAISRHSIKKQSELCSKQIQEFCSEDNTGQVISTWPKADRLEFIIEIGKICKPDHILLAEGDSNNDD